MAGAGGWVSQQPVTMGLAWLSFIGQPSLTMRLPINLEATHWGRCQRCVSALMEVDEAGASTSFSNPSSSWRRLRLIFRFWFLPPLSSLCKHPSSDTNEEDFTEDYRWILSFDFVYSSLMTAAARMFAAGLGQFLLYRLITRRMWR